MKKKSNNKANSDYRLLLKKYKQAKNKFFTNVNDDGYGIVIIDHERTNFPEEYGRAETKDNELTASELNNRINLFTEALAEHKYLEKLKAHANMINTGRLKSDSRLYTESPTATDVDSSSSSENFDDGPSLKRRKLGAKATRLNPSLESKAIYSTSFVVSDENPNPEKQKMLEASRGKKYQEKRRKIIEEAPTPSETRKISFASNYVLQKQLQELELIRTGKHTTFYEYDRDINELVSKAKKIIADIPNSSDEFRNAPLKINTLIARKKNKATNEGPSI